MENIELKTKEELDKIITLLENNGYNFDVGDIAFVGKEKDGIKETHLKHIEITLVFDK